MAGRKHISEILEFSKIEAICQFNPTMGQLLAALALMGHRCSHKTIERYIKEETGKGFKELKERCTDGTKFKLQQKAVTMALGGDRTMLIFCLKNLCNWTDNVQQNLVGDDLKITLNYDPKK